MSKEKESASGVPEGARRATGGTPEERRDGRGRWCSSVISPSWLSAASTCVNSSSSSCCFSTRKSASV